MNIDFLVAQKDTQSTKFVRVPGVDGVWMPTNQIKSDAIGNVAPACHFASAEEIALLKRIPAVREEMVGRNWFITSSDTLLKDGPCRTKNGKFKPLSKSWHADSSEKHAKLINELRKKRADDVVYLHRSNSGKGVVIVSMPFWSEGDMTLFVVQSDEGVQEGWAFLIENSLNVKETVAKLGEETKHRLARFRRR